MQTKNVFLFSNFICQLKLQLWHQWKQGFNGNLTEGANWQIAGILLPSSCDVVDVLLLLMMIMLVTMKMLESLLIMITVMMMMTTSFHLLLSLWCNDDEDNKQKHIFFFWWRSWWSTSQVLQGATNWRFADIVSNLLQPVQKYSFLHLLIIFWYLFLNLPMSYPTFQHPSKNIFFCIYFQLGYQVTRFFDPVSVSIRYLSTKKSATAGCDKYQLLL